MSASETASADQNEYGNVLTTVMHFTFKAAATACPQHQSTHNGHTSCQNFAAQLVTLSVVITAKVLCCMLAQNQGPQHKAHCWHKMVKLRHICTTGHSRDSIHLYRCRYTCVPTTNIEKKSCQPWRAKQVRQRIRAPHAVQSTSFCKTGTSKGAYTSLTQQLPTAPQCLWMSILGHNAAAAYRLGSKTGG
jgi:hypothetical protein